MRTRAGSRQKSRLAVHIPRIDVQFIPHSGVEAAAKQERSFLMEKRADSISDV